MLDVGVNFYTGFVDPATDRVVLDPMRVHANYLKGWFGLDLISGIPVELIAIADPAVGEFSFMKGLKIIKVLRLIKLMRLPVLRRLERHNPTMFRMNKVSLMIFFILHVMACAYWAMVRTFCLLPLSSSSSSSSATAAVAVGGGAAAAAVRMNKDSGTDPFCPYSNTSVSLGAYNAKYVEAGHWSLLTLLGNGPIRLESESEYRFVAFMLFFGIGASSAILGAISLVISSLDVSSMERDSELAAVRQFMAAQGAGRVPRALENRVTQFFAHEWDVGTAPYYGALRTRLPPSLALDLDLQLKRRLIETVPMFANCLPGTTLGVVQALTSTTAVPSEVIMREGALGDCMYFLSAGRVSVSHADSGGTEVLIVTLHDGAFFGELALLGCRVRSATVRALTYCELEVLPYAAFDDLLKTHDDLLALVIDCAKVRIDRLRQSYKDGRLAGLRASERVRVAREKISARSEKLTSRLSAHGTPKGGSARRLGGGGGSPQKQQGEEAAGSSGGGEGEAAAAAGGVDQNFWAAANASIMRKQTVFDLVRNEAQKSSPSAGKDSAMNPTR